MKMEKLEFKTKLIRVYGIVQGVGFRPFVSRIADRAGIRGSVANKGSYVEIYATGTNHQLGNFLEDLEKHPPERSAVLKMDVKEIPFHGFEHFLIIESEKEEGDIFVSPDIAICKKCQKELYDPSDRRYMHPFINCTACGPRLTILDSMPYDRERTSMGEFFMCRQCQYEYTHAETRRYDAQPVCCNDCGPEVYLLGRKERGRDAITAARKALIDGKIVAVKGIGGFHLCCDATNENAVLRLRKRKMRPVKPFAVMMKNLETVQRECLMPTECKEVVDGHQKPIFLLKKREDGVLAPSVAPGNPKVGVMLPYAPVQMLLFDYNDGLEMTTDCFVMTSGNVSGAPICRTDQDAQKELSAFCDLILSHDRKIRLRADDSVMDYYKGKPYMIRRSRGYAPLPIMLSDEFKGNVLAVGGELKNTFCIGKNQLFYPSPYVGDMADLRTVMALEESIGRMEELLESKPSIVACDMHPKYNTTEVAKEQGIEVFQVQHHFAHIVSCMAENDYDMPVIGISFDGTGYGTDGTIWGGEFLKVSFTAFERIGSIRPFLQIGGDVSAKEGWRIAVSMINGLYSDPAQASFVVQNLGLCDEDTRKIYQKMAEKRINSVTSTSAGRLFDAVSAILGICKSSTYEGEASIFLQFAAEAYEERTSQEEQSRIIEGCMEECQTLMNLGQTNGRFLLSTDQLMDYLIKKRMEKEETGKLAYLFHVLLAKQIIQGCRKASEITGLRTCALSGGVFQNLLLLKLCDIWLTEKGFYVLKHSLIPPNDGGIAVGQAVAAMAHIQKSKQEKKEKD